MTQALNAGLAYFAWVFGAGFGLGAIRVPLLVPRMGERAAEFLLAVALSDRTLGQYIAGRDPLSGADYLCMLAVFAAMPLLRLRR